MKPLRGTLLIGVAFLAVFALKAFPAQPVEESEEKIVWRHSLSEALAQASSNNKLIIVDLVADWCGWCRQMEAQTWPNAKVIQQAQQYVFLRLNGENEEDGIELIEKFQVAGYPTVMLLNADGSEFDRFEGFMSADQFLSRLTASLANPQTLGNLTAQEKKNGDDLSLRYKVGQTLFRRNAFRDAQLRFEKIAEQDPGNKSNLVESALLMLALCQASQDDLSAALATVEQFQKTFPESEKLPEASLLSADLLLRSGASAQAKAKAQDFLKTYPDHKLAPTAKRLLSEIQ
jgi:thioredoxin-like negative regulator of GroEL